MPHASGNPPWEQYPSTATPITAARLEALEAAVDAASAAARKVKGPYSPSSYASLAAGVGGRVVGQVVVPDPGWDWQPLVYGSLEVRAAATGTRPAASVYRGSVAAGNMVGHGSGLDPVNQGANGNGYWQVPVIPYFEGTPLVAAGATAAARTFFLVNAADYGSAQIQSTNFYAQLLVYAVPV